MRRVTGRAGGERDADATAGDTMAAMRRATVTCAIELPASPPAPWERCHAAPTAVASAAAAQRFATQKM